MYEDQWWAYDNLPSGAPYDWSPAVRGEGMFDGIDFHLDVGCGKLKKGRLGIDRFLSPEVDLAIDLETLRPALLRPEEGFQDEKTVEHYRSNPSFMLASGPSEFRSCLPFPDGSIKSIISHHALEHIGPGFIPLMDEFHRILEPGGILRIIVPLFPSRTAVEDPDHKRWFMTGTFDAFCGAPDGGIWCEGFSVPYTKARFQMLDKDFTPGLKPRESWGDPDVEGLEPDEVWGATDAREIRVALRKYPEEEQHAEVRGSEIHEGWGDDLGAEDGDAGGTPEAGRDRDIAGVR